MFWLGLPWFTTTSITMYSTFLQFPTVYSNSIISFPISPFPTCFGNSFTMFPYRFNHRFSRPRFARCVAASPPAPRAPRAHPRRRRRRRPGPGRRPWDRSRRTPVDLAKHAKHGKTWKTWTGEGWHKIYIRYNIWYMIIWYIGWHIYRMTVSNE